MQQLHLVLISIRIRAILAHTKGLTTLFAFEAVVRRHHVFDVDVCGTLWKLDKGHDMAGTTSCYRTSNSVFCSFRKVSMSGR